MRTPPTGLFPEPYGLCVFGLTYTCGLAGAGTPRANPKPMPVDEILALAQRDGLRHVELPTALLPVGDPAALRALRVAATGLGLRILVSGGEVLREDLPAAIDAAAELGSPVLRLILSRVLCGQRLSQAGGWDAHVARCLRTLDKAVARAECCGVSIAVENHQDADSDDLLAMCRHFESAHFGITLDTGNPLAVAEDPVAFTRRLAPFVRHVHMKDYRIHPTPDGYRLVRCALGDGVIPFRELFALLDKAGSGGSRSIEMAALQGRHIPLLDPAWWRNFPKRQPESGFAALAFAWPRLRPRAEDWRTPWEAGAAGDEVLAWETDQHQRSVEWLRGFAPPERPD